MIALLRVALRSLRRSPAFTLTVILTLGIGIGLNTAIFTVVDCVLLRPLGYHDADRIVGLQSHFIDKSRSIPRMGGDDYTDIFTGRFHRPLCVGKLILCTRSLWIRKGSAQPGNPI